jgi:catechol 2,3-dioxygenase-like lactoylglutathione lyase family enzyme
MARGLDHLVHAVHDLDAAGDFYRRLGFTVGARNRHPWGTHNRIVQFPGCFIELLTIGEPEKITQAEQGTFSFGAFMRDFLGRGEGLAMLALESRDAQADAEGFRAAGIGDFAPFHFEREGQRPDGTTVKLGFSLAFARDSRAPDAGFFVCQQHYPQNFWDPAFQTHANGATGIAAIVLVAENPTDHHIFLSALTAVRDLQATSTGVTVETPRGAIQAMDPAAFRLHYGIEPPDVGRGARLAAARFSVRDLAATRGCLEKSGVAASDHMGRIVVPPTAAHGAILVFEAGQDR